MATLDTLANGSALHTNGTPTDEPVQPTIAAFDPSIFRSYLLALIPPFLGASPDELETIFDDEFEERISRFAGEGGGVIYVVKKKEETEGARRVSIVRITHFDT